MLIVVIIKVIVIGIVVGDGNGGGARTKNCGSCGAGESKMYLFKCFTVDWLNVTECGFIKICSSV